MVCLVHDVFNIIIEQHVHDLCRRLVFRQFVYIVFYSRIQVFQPCDQHVGVFQNGQQHDPRIVRAAAHQAVDGIDIPLIFDLLPFLDLQKGSDDLDRIFLKTGPLDIALVRLDLDPVIVFQPPQHPVGLIPAAFTVEALFLHGSRLLLFKIILQLLHQNISFHTKRKLMVHDRKQLYKAFPIDCFVRRCQRYKKIFRNDLKHVRLRSRLLSAISPVSAT